MSDYVGVVTATGQAKIAGAIGGAALDLTTIRVGDGNGAEITPTEAMTDLVRRVGAAYPITSSGRDPVNPTHWRVAAIIPSGDGPFDIREIGVFDAAGDMIAIARHVRVTKLSPAQGAAIELSTEVVFPVSETAQVTVTIPPAGQVSAARLMRAGWLTVNSATVTAPPATPAIGDTYLVPAGAIGAWSGAVGSLVQWDGVTWTPIPVPVGFVISVADVGPSSTSRLQRRNATGWTVYIADQLNYGTTRYATLAEAQAATDPSIAISPATLPPIVRDVKRSQVVADRGTNTQSIPSGPWTRVTTFGAVTQQFFGGSTFAAGVMTVGASDGGVWAISINCRQFVATNFGHAVALVVNGTIRASDGGPGNASSLTHSAATRLVTLVPGDTVEMQVVQTSGAAVTFNDIFSFAALRLGGA